METSQAKEYAQRKETAQAEFSADYLEYMRTKEVRDAEEKAGRAATPAAKKQVSLI
jgi:hypothetical protein